MNLLYKVGKTTAARIWQELEVTKDKELAIDKSNIKTIDENLQKMKKENQPGPRKRNNNFFLPAHIQMMTSICIYPEL
jgi:hypothetical protein